MPCLVCGEPRTIKAHIMPRALLHEIRADQPFALHGVRDRDGATFLQSGLWDGGILCEFHERHLAESDDYAVEFCRTFANTAKPVEGAPGYIVPNPRPEFLTRFVMSVFWRFTVSRHGKAVGAHLGPYEARLRTLVFEPSAGHSEPEIVVVRHDYQIDGRTIKFAINPHSARINGIMRWQFHIASLDFQMKLGDRPDGLPQMLYAQGSDPLIVVDNGPEDVRDTKAIRTILDRIGAGQGRDRWFVDPRVGPARENS